MLPVAWPAPTERPGVLFAQIDLVMRDAEPESHRLLGRAAVKIVFQYDGYLRCHRGLHDCTGLSALTDQVSCRDYRTPANWQPLYECTRPDPVRLASIVQAV